VVLSSVLPRANHKLRGYVAHDTTTGCGVSNTWLALIMYCILQPLVTQLVESNKKLLELNKDVKRLQELSDEIAQEKKEEEMSTRGQNVAEDQSITPANDNLIDLSSPVEHLDSEELDSESNDILSESLAESSVQLQADVLQPSITNSDSIQQLPTDSQQSQELF